MQIDPVCLSNKLIGMTIRHGKETIDVTRSIYGRSTFSNADDMFLEINGYWATLPMATQDQIWTIFKQLDYLQATCFNERDLRSLFTSLVADLYDLMDIRLIRQWLFTATNVFILPEFKSQLGPDDQPERTYLINDYKGLLALTVTLRPMIPIWSWYITRIKNSAGTNHKEYEALSLLKDTTLIHTPEFIKLKDYVYNNTDHSKLTLTAAFSGLGSEDLSDWLLSFGLIRKVCVGVILKLRPDGSVPRYDSGANIVSNVYMDTDQTLNSIDRKFKNKVLDKGETNNVIDDDKASNAENIIVKQSLSDAQIILAEIYTDDFRLMLRKIDPTIPIGLVQSFIRANRRNTKYIPTEGQLGITQWIMYKALSCHFLTLVDSNARRNIISVCQAALWHWGFYDLAMLLTATEVKLDLSDPLPTMAGQQRITNAQVDILHDAYPYYQSTTNKDLRSRNENVAVTGCDLVAKTFEGLVWDLAIPEELENQIGLVSYESGGYLAPSNLRVQLADLVIKIVVKPMQEQ